MQTAPNPWLECAPPGPLTSVTQGLGADCTLPPLLSSQVDVQETVDPSLASAAGLTAQGACLGSQARLQAELAASLSLQEQQVGLPRPLCGMWGLGCPCRLQAGLQASLSLQEQQGDHLSHFHGGGQGCPPRLQAEPAALLSVQPAGRRLGTWGCRRARPQAG